MSADLDKPSNKLPESGGGFSKPGLGGKTRNIDWPSFSATSKMGTANPTCAVCGGRQRGSKKCTCVPEVGPTWKPMGKRRNPENDFLSGEMSGTGMHLAHMQAFHERWLSEAYRILAPGGTIKAFSSTRTFHRLAMAMENVGFVGLREEAWFYCSGFPKSLNVGVATYAHSTYGKSDSTGTGHARDRAGQHWSEFPKTKVVDNQKPQNPLWAGWGTAMKPAHEICLVATKPHI